MNERTHGLKDLFGSVPDAGGTPPKPAASAPAAAPRQDAPAAERAASGGHGLSGLGAPAPVIEGVPPTPDLPPSPLPPEPAAAPAPRAAPSYQPSSGAAGLVPPLAVVLVARSGWKQARRTVEALRQQTAAAQVALLLVSPDTPPAAEVPSEFGAIEHVPVARDAAYGKAAAAGLRAARSDLVALLDDYAFPAGDWAEHVLSHRHEGFAALGGAFGNANPRSRYAWANMLLEHGAWREGSGGGEVTGLPGRNVVFRREALEAVDGQLVELLARENGLTDKLAQAGGRLILDPEARLALLNPSTLRDTLRARYAAGRLAAAEERAAMKPIGRFARAVPAALGGYGRFRKSRSRLFAGGAEVNPKLHGSAVLLGFVSEGLGRAAGLVRGPGKAQATREKLAERRYETLNKVDRRQFAADRKKR